MFSVDKLLQLGLFNQVIPMWQVFFYIGVLVPFLLCRRIKTCLFLTYLFTFYLGFLVQWGDYLAQAGALLPFALYALSGIFVSLVFIILVFKEEGFSVSFGWRRRPSPGLERFDLDQKP
ncbi:MAG TPA: hypothetical protein VNN77_08985 [candidate division Zixibacteria bacterium]|nr:hypothetical protein [candidate division Zixibacteria bacterium]